MKKEVAEQYREKAREMYKKANIVISPEESENIEIVELGLDDFEKIGLSIITYVNTDYYCAKEMVLMPHQTCPEHTHKPMPEIGYMGKQETFRCRYGKVFLYVAGEPAKAPKCKAPEGYEKVFTVWHEIELNPGEQYTIMPDTLHWFTAGDEGAVISEFSTTSHDEYDIFTDDRINRLADFD